MIKTYTYKILPNERVERKTSRWMGVCRLVYNLGIESREDSWKKGVSKNYYSLSKELTEVKKEFEWMREIHSQTLQGTLEQLERGYKKFFKDLKEGVPTSKPKFMSKKKQRSIPFKSIKIKENCFVLPKFGRVKVFKFKMPKGKLRTARIVREADGLYLHVQVRNIKKELPTRENQSLVGLDMGIAHFLTTSDGEFIENPKHLFGHLRELRVQQRKLDRMKRYGSNYYKQLQKIQRLHLKVRRSRRDFLHKLSTRMAVQYDTVCIEDLNIKEMVKDSGYSKHILDCGWGTFFGMLEYKTNVVRVNPEYTSQECSSCGHVSKKNRKTQSHFKCVECGYKDNADLNASKNIKSRGHSVLEANVSH